MSATEPRRMQLPKHFGVTGYHPETPWCTNVGCTPVEPTDEAFPLYIRNPRERSFQVKLEFGPHSFTLLEYESQSVAESAKHSIEQNYRAHVRAAARPDPLITVSHGATAGISPGDASTTAGAREWRETMQASGEHKGAPGSAFWTDSLAEAYAQHRATQLTALYYKENVYAGELYQRAEKAEQLLTLARAQRDWLIKECARIGVQVNVRIGAQLSEAYQLVNTQASLLLGALDKFGRHLMTCPRAKTGAVDCYCGFDAASDAARTPGDEMREAMTRARGQREGG